MMCLQEDGTVLEMDFNTYLMGVLFGEMPVDFDIEALKAQAILARTYAYKYLISPAYPSTLEMFIPVSPTFSVSSKLTSSLFS